MFFECNLINNFWRRIDRKFKEIINSNTPFSLNMKQIVLLGTEGRELEEGEEEMPDNELLGSKLLSFFILEGLQIIHDARLEVILNGASFNVEKLYLLWEENIKQRIIWAVRSYNESSWLNEKKENEKMDKLKDIQKTWGLNGKLVYLNDLTKLFKYNFINLKYNPPNLSDEEADEGLEIMNIMEQEGLEIGKQIELEQETLKKMKENLNSVNS